jgi:type IV secretion system protein VirB4
MQIEILNQQGQFMFFRRLLNYDDWRVAGRPQSTQFLDYQVVNSDIEAERDHLRVMMILSALHPWSLPPFRASYSD